MQFLMTSMMTNARFSQVVGALRGIGLAIFQLVIAEAISRRQLLSQVFLLKQSATAFGNERFARPSR